MKKLTVLILSLFMALAFLQNSYAHSRYKTYEVAEIKESKIIVTDESGKLYVIEKDPDDLEVGDIIKYDNIRDRLKKSPWQLATIVEMADYKITLELRNGKKIEVNMRSGYREEFSQGEEVLFKKSAGRLKKNGYELPEDE